MFLGSKPGTPIVALDVDGTIADYHSHFIEFASRYLGLPEGEVIDPDWDEQYEGEFSLALGLTKETYRDIKLAYRQGGLKRSIPLFEGARNLVSAIHEAEAEVWFCTTRPWQRLDNIDPDTRFFFDHNGFDYNGVIYGENKYADLLEIVGPGRVVAVVDDLPEMCNQALDLGLNPIMHRGAHNYWWRKQNRNMRGTMGPRHRSLVSIQSLIIHRINAWKEQQMAGMKGSSPEERDALAQGAAQSEWHHDCGLRDKGCQIDGEHGHGTDRAFPSLLDQVDAPVGDLLIPRDELYGAPPGLGWALSPESRAMLDTNRDPDDLTGMKMTIVSHPRKAGKKSQIDKIAAVCNIFDEAQTVYRDKAQGYNSASPFGDLADLFGTQGQFKDITRKWGKLWGMLHTGEIPMFPDEGMGENVIEVLEDLMGHCALTIYALRKEQEKVHSGDAEADLKHYNEEDMG